MKNDTPLTLSDDWGTLTGGRGETYRAVEHGGTDCDGCAFLSGGECRRPEIKNAPHAFICTETVNDGRREVVWKRRRAAP